MTCGFKPPRALPSLERARLFEQMPKNEKPAGMAGLRKTLDVREIGAGEGIRTLDPNLGKVVLYP